MNENNAILRQYIRSLIVEQDSDKDDQKKTDSKVTAAVVLRRAIGLALADESAGIFSFSPPSAGPTSSTGIRINPADSNITGDSAVSNLIKSTQAAGLNPSEKTIAQGEEGSKSGKFPTLPVAVDESWFDGAGEPFVQLAITQADVSDVRKEELRQDIYGTGGRDRRRAKRPTSVNVVLRAKSLESRLFTGQGLGELAEYAVAGAVNGASQFEKAIETAVLKNSWSNADQEMRDRFRAIYEDMLEITSRKMSEATAASGAPNNDALFGKGASVQGAGGGRYDVETSNARIHVKFDIGGSMTRLAGIKPEYSEEFNKDAAVEDRLKNISFGSSTYYWKYVREEFKKNLGLDISLGKDKKLLRDIEFYQWLLGLQSPIAVKVGEELSRVTPDQVQWLSSEKPDFKSLLLNDVKSEFIDDPSANESATKYYYFTFYPDKDLNINKLKIEQLGVPQAPLTDLDVRMNPTYLSGQQIGSPYILVDGADNVLMEFEFRARNTSKPIQMHRGKDFATKLGSDKASLSTVLAEKIVRKAVRKALINEALTPSDKKEIERLAKRQAKALLDRELSGAIEKEIKKRNGAFKKQTDDAITARFKNAKSDKDFDEAVIKISKRVLKALHDMHYKRANLIDKMPVPKS